MKLLNTILGLAIASAIFGSCEKEPKPIIRPQKEKGNLQLNVTKSYNNKIIGISPIEDTLLDGRKIRITSADIFLSEIGLEDESILTSYADQPLVLVKGNKTRFDLGQINVGAYYKLKLKSGLTTTLNDKNNTYDLYLNDTSMWYNPNNIAEKYIHIKIVGEVDTTERQTGLGFAPIELYLGAGTVTKPISLELYTGINKGESTSIFLNINFAKLFNGIDLIPRENRVINNSNLAITRGHIYRNNVDSMFSTM